jgi:FkbM family methyltransferase
MSAARALYRPLHRRYVLQTERVVSTPYAGSHFFYPDRSIIGRAIADGRGWDKTLPRIVDALLPTTPVVIEVGSNIGASLVQIKRARPAAVVYCCEPSLRFTHVLRRNIESYGWHDVEVVEAVFASGVERRPLHSNTTTASVVSADYGNHEFLESTTIETTTLDTVFGALNRLDFVKVDTDGFDHDVLLGAAGLLTRFQPVVHFEFAPKLLDAAGRDPLDAILYMQSLSYRKLILLELDGSLLATSCDPANIVALAREHNYVDIVAVHETRQAMVVVLEELLGSEPS